MFACGGLHVLSLVRLCVSLSRVRALSLSLSLTHTHLRSGAFLAHGALDGHDGNEVFLLVEPVFLLQALLRDEDLHAMAKEQNRM